MMDRRSLVQEQMILQSIEELVPEDHFVRELDAALDLEFIYERVAPLYSEVGRRSVDPVVLIKLLLLGYIYGIDSERKLEKEAQVNIAFRWYLGLSFAERIPDHSTISQNRRRRFANTVLFQEIFDEVVHQCICRGLVGGKQIVVDSTHIKANAGDHKSEQVTIVEGPDAYWQKLDAVARAAEGERASKKRGRIQREDSCIQTREETKSTTDPDCGLLKRAGKPSGFHYLMHQSADTKFGIITDTHVTAGNVSDHMVCVERIVAQMERYNLPIKEVGGDKGYDYVRVHAELAQLGISLYTPDRNQKRATASELYNYPKFEFDHVANQYICPAGQRLSLANYNRHHENINRVYRCKVATCQACKLKGNCLSPSTRCRTLSRTMQAEYMEKNHLMIGTDRYYEILKNRKVICEGNHSTLKREHCLRRAEKRGLHNVMEQCLLAAAVLNLKKMIKYSHDPSAKV